MTRSEHARLGLFLALSAGLVIAVGIFFALRYQARQKLPCVTYFNESVAGLAPGNTVRFRGVDIGRVEGISVPFEGDYFIEVRFEIYLDVVRTLGGDVQRLKELKLGERFPLNDSMRVRLAANFITGLANLEIEPMNPAPPVLDISSLPQRVYLPSASSSIAQMEKSVNQMLIRLPSMVEHIDQLASTINKTVTEVPIGEVIKDMQAIMKTTSKQIERSGDDLHHLLDQKGPLMKLLTQIDGILEKSDVDGSIREVRATLGETRMLVADLRTALPQFLNTVNYLGGLLRNLQEEPESLIFGPRTQ